ncbi:HEAT repeat domain-containing protein [Planctomycetota bacterium]
MNWNILAMTEQTKPIEPESKQKNNALRLSLWIGVPAVFLILILWVLHNWFGYWVCTVYIKWDFADKQCVWVVKKAPYWLITKGLTKRYALEVTEELEFSYQPGLYGWVDEPQTDFRTRIERNDDWQRLIERHPGKDGNWFKVMYIAGRDEAAPLLIDDEEWMVRGFAIWKLGQKQFAPEEALKKALRDPHPFVRKQAINAITSGTFWYWWESDMKGARKDYLPLLRAMLPQEQNEVVLSALRAAIKRHEKYID